MILIERIGEWYYKTLGTSLICSPMSFLPAITIPSAKQGAKIRRNNKNYYVLSNQQTLYNSKCKFKQISHKITEQQ